MWSFILAVHKSFEFKVSTGSYKVRKLKSTAIYTNKQWHEQINIEFMWPFFWLSTSPLSAKCPQPYINSGNLSPQAFDLLSKGLKLM